MTECPSDGRLLIGGYSSGYFSTGLGSHRSSVGRESCPWVITVQPGQRINLMVILFHNNSATPVNAEEPIHCSGVFIIRDSPSGGAKELGICSGKLRERHFYTSTGNEVVMSVSRGQRNDFNDFRLNEQRDYPRFIIGYEGHSIELSRQTSNSCASLHRLRVVTVVH